MDKNTTDKPQKKTKRERRKDKKELKKKQQKAEARNKKIKKIGILLGVAVLLGAGGYFWHKSATAPSEYDSLAKCLTEKQVKMYGAYWCPHCKNQKKEFGNAFKYINYIECSLPNAAGQNKKCNEANIESYPTWEFKSGKRLTGEIPLEKLAKEAKCLDKLPKQE